MLDKHIVHAVESVVIDWCHQVRDVLSKNSAQPLLQGENPGPLVEISFWKARCADLESVVDQVGGILVSMRESGSTSFPGLPTIQFLIACSMQNRRKGLIHFIT